MPAAAPILAGQVALVTGAGRGIGAAAATALAQAGADVALCDIKFTDGRPTRAIAALARRALELAVDVADQPAVEAMVGRVVAEFGRLDILVLCAAHSDRDFFLDADLAGFRRTLDVSMLGAFYVLRAGARQMVAQGRGGSVVVVSSAHARLAIPSCMAYNMAKAANDQMARTAALELVQHRIRVNILYPGWTDTPGERKYFSEEVLQRAGRAQPLGRLLRPEEVARGVVFLCDPASEAITGSTLAIDGGGQLPYWSKRGTGEF